VRERERERGDKGRRDVFQAKILVIIMYKLQTIKNMLVKIFYCPPRILMRKKINIINN
jgi:hypothetical protein